MHVVSYAHVSLGCFHPSLIPDPTLAQKVFRLLRRPREVAKILQVAESSSPIDCTCFHIVRTQPTSPPPTPLTFIPCQQVLHSAMHPHVIKIAETFASSEGMLDYFHRNYQSYLSGVFDFRAAVNPTVQAYTPLEASLRPCLSATCVCASFCFIFVVFFFVRL